MLDKNKRIRKSRVGKLGASFGLQPFGLFGDIRTILFSTRQEFVKVMVGLRCELFIEDLIFIVESREVPAEWMDLDYLRSSNHAPTSEMMCISAWVKDIDFSPYTDMATSSSNWFWSSIVRRVGDDSTTHFWLDIWSGNANFFSLYRRLYNLNLNQQGFISDLGRWVDDKWEWILPWRRHFFAWESELNDSFLNELHGSMLQVNKPDSWEWKHEKTKQYSSVFWFATMWAIWLSRNELIFNKAESSPKQIFESARDNHKVFIMHCTSESKCIFIFNASYSTFYV
ncbi:hypothetical protein Lal_00029906 [Lupinus albus]|nr:hypothetical protein Lal_00029906 [Lupinus albus]